MVTLYAQDTARLMFRYPQYKDIMWCVCIEGFKSEYVPESKQLSIPKYSDGAMKAVVRFVEGIPESDIVFILSDKLSIQLAVVAAFIDPPNLSEMVNEQLGNVGIYQAVKNYRYEGTAAAQVTSHFTNNGRTPEQILDADMRKKAEEILGGTSETRFMQITDDFDFEEASVHQIKLGEDCYALHILDRFSADRSLLGYLQKHFVSAYAHFSQIWGDDAVIYVVSDSDKDASRKVLDYMFANPGKRIPEELLKE